MILATATNLKNKNMSYYAKQILDFFSKMPELLVDKIVDFYFLKVVLTSQLRMILIVES